MPVAGLIIVHPSHEWLELSSSSIIPPVITKLVDRGSSWQWLGFLRCIVCPCRWNSCDDPQQQVFRLEQPQLENIGFSATNYGVPL